MSLIHKYEALRKAAELSVAGSQDFEPLVDRILTEVVFESLRKYQEKVSVGIQDSFADLVNEFKIKTVDTVFNTAGRWKIVDHEPFLFPKDCRFCYQRGNSIVTVIEQGPQVRTLSFDSKLMGETQTTGTTGNTVRLQLALPYTIFVICFKEDAPLQLRILNSVYCGWRASSLKCLDDTLCQPLLPNIHAGLAVCMGHTRSIPQGTLTEQVEGALTHFWSSRFNNDLSQFWWAKKNLSPKLRSAEIWSGYSTRDSIFILDNSLLPESGKTVRDLVNLLTMNEEEPDESKFRHELTESIDSCVSGLSRGVDRYLKKTKFEKFFPKDVKDATGEIMQDAMRGISDTILCLDHEIQKLAGELAPKKIECIPRSPLWHEYQKEEDS